MQRSAVSKIRGNQSLLSEKILENGQNAAKLLRDIAETINGPYLKTIAGVSLLILQSMEEVRSNKETLNRIAHQVYALICAVINIYHEAVIELPPSMVYNMSQLSETLQKTLTYVRNQTTGGGLLKRLARHAENSNLLEECKEGLSHALSVFSVQLNLISAAKMAEMQRDAIVIHNELMEAAASFVTSSFDSYAARLLRSTSTLSLIPGSPKVFHGREVELKTIIATLLEDQPVRTAILGTGGIGKSSLALAVLHHQDIVEKFGSKRYFISCASATTSAGLITCLASYFGVQDQDNISNAVMRRFASVPGQALLFLDNLETPWEPTESRSQVESFLSQITELTHLHLLVTMRGAERPGQVLWTRPFLPPLLPLPLEAARRTFYDISDPSEDETIIDQLLSFTDNMPLAVTLMAHLASYEGCESVLERWKSETTSLLSDGYDKGSNLEHSISISISSPRITSTPGAKELLSLLSILPDGISDLTLERIGVPILNIAKCRMALCRTSLAFIDHGDRLKCLVPIREYVRHHMPPTPPLVEPIRLYCFELVKPFALLAETPAVASLVRRVTSDLGNINSLVEYSLAEKPDDTDVLYCIVYLSSFAKTTNLGSYELLLSHRDVVENISDIKLKGHYLLALSRIVTSELDSETIGKQALEAFTEINHSLGEACLSLAMYYENTAAYKKAIAICEYGLTVIRDMPESRVLRCNLLQEIAKFHVFNGRLAMAKQYSDMALQIAQELGDLFAEIRCIRVAAYVDACMGDYGRAMAQLTDAMPMLHAIGLQAHDSRFYQAFLRNKAEILLQKTEFTEALKDYRAVVGPNVEWNNPDGKGAGHASLFFNKAYAVLNATYIELVTGDYEDSKLPNRINVLRSVFQTLGEKPGVCLCDILNGELHLNREALITSSIAFEKALNMVLSELEGDPELLVHCLQRLGDVAALQQDFTAMSRHYILFLGATLKFGPKVLKYQALRCLGDVSLANGEEMAALSLFEVALDGLSRMDIPRGRAECMLRIGDFKQKRGKLKEAANHWRGALQLFQHTCQKREVESCRRRLVDIES